jgi:uncharacterized membrane protein (UPF0127 family)
MQKAALAALLFALLWLTPQARAAGLGEISFATGSGSHSFTVELATESGEQAQGLMFRRQLAADRGMLFIYQQPRIISMWMKNTFISLDMVFLDADWRVIRVVERTEPFSTAPISSGGPAIAVLELNAGTARKIGLNRGDQATLQR